MVSAIILTWNSQKYIRRCIESVIESALYAGEQIEFFIADNGSTDKTVEYLKELQNEFPFVTVKYFDENKGTTYPRNLGLKSTNGEYVLFLDSDTCLQKKTLKGLIEFITEHEDVGLVGPRLVYGDGSLQESCKKFPTIFTKLQRVLSNFFPFVETNDLYSRKQLSTEFFPDYCISACWLLRRNILGKVGGLDENIFYAPEDIDFCLRIWKNGSKIAYLPGVTVVHFCQRATYKTLKLAFEHLKGLFYFFRKHHYFFSRKNLYKTLSR